MMRKRTSCFWLLPIVLAGAVSSPAPALGATAEAVPDSGTVYVLPLRGMIEPALLYVVRRGLAEAEAVKARAIVFVMDTLGGTLQAAEDIVRTIHRVTVPTFTFVEHRALSAGAIIALATKHIYMAPGSVIGDAMPMVLTPFGGVQELPEAIEEKMVSGVAALVRAAAQQGGHDPELAEAMVRRELEYRVGEEIICEKGELLTLTNVEAERRFPDRDKPLLSEGTVEDVRQLLQVVGLADAHIKELRVTGAERVARVIAAAAPLLLIVGLLGLYVEFKTPGFGLPGTVGVLALALFFWGHHIAGLAGWEDLVVFLVGMVLLLIELLLIPGFGLVGVLGLMLIVWALLGAMTRSYPGAPWYRPPAWSDLQPAVLKLSAAILGTAAGGVLLGRLLPHTPLWNRLVLAQATRRAEGYTAGPRTERLLGATGVTVSALRPSGVALFGEDRLDVVTRGEYIEPGKKVRIVETHGARIVVEAVPPEEKEA